MFGQCIATKIGNSLMGWLQAVLPVLGVALVIGLIAAAVTGAWAAMPIFLLVLAMMAVATLIGFILTDIISCLIADLTVLLPPPFDSKDQPLVQITTCEEARRALAAAEAAWQAAAAAEHKAAGDYAKKTSRANVARTALVGATAALVVGFLLPWTLPAILAGMAAAAAAYAMAARAAGDAQAKLIAAGEKLRLADNTLAKARKDVERLCGVTLQPPVPPVTVPITISPSALGG